MLVSLGTTGRRTVQTVKNYGGSLMLRMRAPYSSFSTEGSFGAVLLEGVLDQNGPKWSKPKWSKRPFWSNNGLISNRILAFARPKWTKMVYFGLKRSIFVHLGPPTVLWPFLINGSHTKQR